MLNGCPTMLLTAGAVLKWQQTTNLHGLHSSSWSCRSSDELRARPWQLGTCCPGSCESWWWGQISSSAASESPDINKIHAKLTATLTTVSWNQQNCSPPQPHLPVSLLVLAIVTITIRTIWTMFTVPSSWLSHSGASWDERRWHKILTRDRDNDVSYSHVTETMM